MNSTIRTFVTSKRQVILSSITFLVSIIVIFVALIPLVRAIWTQYNKNKDFRTQNTILKTKDALLMNLDEQNLRDELKELTAAVPTDKSVPSLLSALEIASSQNGVLLSDISLSPPGLIATESASEPTGKEISLTYTVGVEGNPENIRKFFSTITSSRRLMRIQKFNISITTPEFARANISMDAVYGPLPKTIGTVATPLEVRTVEEEELLARITLLPKLTTTESAPLPLLIGPLKSDPFSP